MIKTKIYELKKIEDTIELIVERVKIIEDMMNNVDDNFTKQAISSVGDSLTDLGNMVRYHSAVLLFHQPIWSVLSLSPLPFC